MNTAKLTSRAIATAAFGLALVLGACASNPDKPPSGKFDRATAESAEIDCPTGYLLTCESKRTGRIRFGKMGGRNLDSCSCLPETGRPTMSTVPSIQ